MPVDDFLTVAEIAERLKLNQQTIRNWIDRGNLPAVRLGPRRIRVRLEDLERFIADSSEARMPTEESARAAFSDALGTVTAAAGTAAEPQALRALARASSALALALSRRDA